MIDFRKAINLIKRNGGFYSNKQDDSYYRTYIAQGYRPMQVRVSNHGTHLRTWYDKDYDPSYAINTCIVYSPNGECNSNVDVDMNIKDEHRNIIGQKKPFEVIQYVYNCQLLNENDSALINKAVQSIWQNKVYKDPLINTQKQAKVYRLIPNNQIEIITENKEYKTNKNMAKNKIRITENELKQIVNESVKKVLNETYKQDIVDKAIQSLFEIKPLINSAAREAGFNPKEGDRQINKIIMQISQLITALDGFVNADYYQNKWDTETHEQD